MRFKKRRKGQSIFPASRKAAAPTRFLTEDIKAKTSELVYFKHALKGVDELAAAPLQADRLQNRLNGLTDANVEIKSDAVNEDVKASKCERRIQSSRNVSEKDAGISCDEAKTTSKISSENLNSTDHEPDSLNNATYSEIFTKIRAKLLRSAAKALHMEVNDMLTNKDSAIDKLLSKLDMVSISPATRPGTNSNYSSAMISSGPFYSIPTYKSNHMNPLLQWGPIQSNKPDVSSAFHRGSFDLSYPLLMCGNDPKCTSPKLDALKLFRPLLLPWNDVSSSSETTGPCTDIVDATHVYNFRSTEASKSLSFGRSTYTLGDREHPNFFDEAANKDSEEFNQSNDKALLPFDACIPYRFRGVRPFDTLHETQENRNADRALCFPDKEARSRKMLHSSNESFTDCKLVEKMVSGERSSLEAANHSFGIPNCLEKNTMDITWKLDDKYLECGLLGTIDSERNRYALVNTVLDSPSHGKTRILDLYHRKRERGMDPVVNSLLYDETKIPVLHHLEWEQEINAVPSSPYDKIIESFQLEWEPKLNAVVSSPSLYSQAETPELFHLERVSEVNGVLNSPPHDKLRSDELLYLNVILNSPSLYAQTRTPEWGPGLGLNAALESPLMYSEIKIPELYHLGQGPELSAVLSSAVLNSPSSYVETGTSELHHMGWEPALNAVLDSPSCDAETGISNMFHMEQGPSFDYYQANPFLM